MTDEQHDPNPEPGAPESSAPASDIPADESLPPQDVPEVPLREDGPTLDEYLLAGYSEDTYPPSGYAAKPTVPFTTVKPGQSKAGYSVPLHPGDKA